MDGTWIAQGVTVAGDRRTRRRGVKLGDPRVLLPVTAVHGRGLAAPLRLIAFDVSGTVVRIRRLDVGSFVRIQGASWILEQPLADPVPRIGDSIAIYARRCDWQANPVRHPDRKPG